MLGLGLEMMQASMRALRAEVEADMQARHAEVEASVACHVGSTIAAHGNQGSMVSDDTMEMAE